MNSSDELICLLKRASISYDLDVDLKRKTWIKRGGIASIWIEPKTLEEMLQALSMTEECGLPMEILGGSSNCYFQADYHPPVVLSTLHMREMSQQGDFLVCLCGCRMIDVSKWAIEHGYEGYEGFISLPGTVAGAAINNAGCYGSLISDCIEDVDVYAEGKRIHLSNADLEYRHRSSKLKRNPGEMVVLTVRFRLSKKNDPNRLQERALENKRLRRSSQEHQYPNLGSTFSILKSSRTPFVRWLKLFVMRALIHVMPIPVGAKNKLLTRSVLAIYKAGALKKYISKYSIGCFIWSDDEADRYFFDYIRFVQQIHEQAVLEIEIKDGKRK